MGLSYIKSPFWGKWVKIHQKKLKILVFGNISYYLCAKMGDFYEFYIMLYNVITKDPSLTLRMTYIPVSKVKDEIVNISIA